MSVSSTLLRCGDMVMIIAGGHSEKRPIKGQVGKIMRFVGDRQRAIVEGLNMVTRHQRQKGPQAPAAKVRKEASVHVSNLMYYVEKLKKPAKLRRRLLADGKKVRGYLDPKSKEFVQV